MTFEEAYGWSLRGERSQPEASDGLRKLEQAFQRWQNRDKAEGAAGVESVAGTEKRLQQLMSRPRPAAGVGCGSRRRGGLARAEVLAEDPGHRRGPGLFGGWHK